MIRLLSAEEPEFILYKEPDCKRANVQSLSLHLKIEAGSVSLRKGVQSKMEKKGHRSGRCQRTEPVGLDLALRDEGVRQAFQNAGCWSFCEKL